MVDIRRVRLLNERQERRGAVVYWMSRDQRVRDNWALLFAQELALRLRRPLVVVFCLVPRFLGATIRQYGFMLKGLQEVSQVLQEKNIGFALIAGRPEQEVPTFIHDCGGGALVTDFDPLRVKREWKTRVAERIKVPCYEVDAHNIVPCWVASPKQEYAARTFRPNVRRVVAEFIKPFPSVKKHRVPWHGKLRKVAWNKVGRQLQVDRTVQEVDWITPGGKAAKPTLRWFLRHRLVEYDEARNDPNKEGQSSLSPYPHFGQIPAQRVAIEILKSDPPAPAKEAFLEELIVRREVA